MFVQILQFYFSELPNLYFIFVFVFINFWVFFLDSFILCLFFWEFYKLVEINNFDVEFI